VRRLEQEYAANTVRNIATQARGALKLAVEDEVLAKSPWVKVVLPRAETRAEAPAAEHVAALLACAEGWMSVAVHLGAGAGLRQGEVAGLEGRHIDFLRRRVVVEQQRGPAGSVTAPKTPSSVRWVPLPAQVLEVLSSHHADGRLLVNERGNPIRSQLLSHHWTKLKARAGVPASLDFHDLRHFYASRLLSAGVNPVAVAQLLGHRSAKTTLDIYGHFMPDDEAVARSTVERVLADISRTPANAHII
jgi:integrase